MSEQDNIVAVYREIDTIAAQDPDARERIATVVRPYRDATRIGWTETEAGRLIIEGVPTVDEALVNMAETTPGGRLRSRRLLALAALLRADPPRFGRDGPDAQLVANALVPLMPREDNGPPEDEGVAEGGDRVEQLLTLLEGRGGASIFGDLDAWRAMLEEARDNNLLDDETAAQTTPPCRDSVAIVEIDGEPDPVLEIETVHTPRGVDLADLEPFLDPINWPACSDDDLWEGMTRLNPGAEPACYLEVVRFTSSFALKTCLEFTRVPFDGGVLLSFRKCTDEAHLQQSDRRVTLDEGNIHAVEEVGGLRISTSKWVAFAEPFSAGLMSMFTCMLGYADVGEELISSCLNEGNP